MALSLPFAEGVPLSGPLFRKWVNYRVVLPTLAPLPLPLGLALAHLRGRWRQRQRPDLVIRMLESLQKQLDIDEGTARDLVRRIFENKSREEWEAHLIGCLRPSFLARHVTFEGATYLDQALARGRGAILSFSHFGPFPMAMALLGMKGYQNHVVAGAYGPPHTDPIETWHIHRKVTGICRWMRGEFYFVGVGPSTELYRRGWPFQSRPLEPRRGASAWARGVLSANGVLMIAVDAQLGESDRLTVEFFGRPTRFPYSFLKLAQETDAIVLPQAILQEPKGVGYRIRIDPPLPLPKGQSREAYREALQQAIDFHVDCIRRYPDHWSHLDTPAHWANLEGMWSHGLGS